MGRDFQSRLTKAFRVRGPRVRQIYHTARRVERFFRDAERRAALEHLPPTTIRIEPDAGFLVVKPGVFEEAGEIVRDAREQLARFNAAAPPEGKNRKRFLQNVLDASTLTLDSAALRFALRENVLAAVVRYLRIVPFLTSIQVFHSDTIEGLPTSSQLYHCDGDDVTQVKVFVYCSDVDAASGPLTMLDARTSRDVQRRTGYWYRHRLTDDDVQRLIGRGHEHPILGAAGTTVFVDTSRCFHFGSRVAPDAPARLVTMIQYQTPYSFMVPTSAQGSLPFRRLLKPGLGTLQRQVLGE